ncbi:uncharacterized protein ACNLHF_026271 [Anomaloglossus baeobatrachus]
MSDYFELGPMAEDEDQMAVESHIITLNILCDALNKKGWLLADPGKDYGPRAVDAPLISPQLVEGLIQTLQQVQLLKHHKTKTDLDDIAEVYPVPGAPVIGLCQEFWQRHENLRPCSRPGILITAVAHILGHSDGDNDDDDADQCWTRKKEDHRSVLRSHRIGDAFELWMRHEGNYVNGSYTCCGETSVYSVCEDSNMRFFLHSELAEEQRTVAETSRKATLNVLYDVYKKGLFLDEDHLLRSSPGLFPLITSTLLGDLIKMMRKATFKCDKKPRNELLFAYSAPHDIVYLCPLFWKQKPRLGYGSQIGTLILCSAQMLGYTHILNGTSNPKEPTRSREGNLLTADDICTVFEVYMNHRETYTEGSYSCCGENAEDSVCKESSMALVLKDSLKV